MADGRVDAMAVVVPARDESAQIGACLAGVAEARRTVARHGVPVVTVVVADCCDDDTAEIADRLGAQVLQTATGAVGAARAAGCALALRVLAGVPSRRIWLAGTDADTVVPPQWLSAQLRAAQAGYDAAAGLVRLDGGGGQPVAARWHTDYDAECRREWLHGRVHGANLGIRGDAYRQVGGFDSVPAHEDLRLVRRLQAAGRPVAWPEQPAVVTSARLRSRAPAGVGRDLRRLA